MVKIKNFLMVLFLPLFSLYAMEGEMTLDYWSHLPPEIHREILNKLDTTELKAIPPICESLETVRIDILNQRGQKLSLLNPKELSSYLEEDHRKTPQIQRVQLSFIPENSLLERLGKKCLEIWVPTPIGENRIQKAKDLLTHEPVYFNLVNPTVSYVSFKKPGDYLLGEWNFLNLKEVWDLLGNEAPEIKRTREKLPRILQLYSLKVTSSSLKKALSDYPFYPNILIKIKGENLSEAEKENIFKEINQNLIDYPHVTALHFDSRCRSMKFGDDEDAPLGNKGVETLRNAFHNKNLTTLNLSGNKLEDEAAEILGSLLLSHKNLSTLNLEWNEITDKGLDALGESLKSNTTLTFLSVAGNKITNEGVQRLGELLSSYNKTLRTLEIGPNEGVNDPQIIGNIRRKNPHLTITPTNYPSKIPPLYLDESLSMPLYFLMKEKLLLSSQDLLP